MLPFSKVYINVVHAQAYNGVFLTGKQNWIKLMNRVSCHTTCLISHTDDQIMLFRIFLWILTFNPMELIKM